MVYVSHCDTFILECQGKMCAKNICMARKPGKKLGEFLTLRLEDDLKAGLEVAADDEERTVGQLIRILLREGLERRRGGKKTLTKATSKTRSSK